MRAIRLAIAACAIIIIGAVPLVAQTPVLRSYNYHVVQQGHTVQLAFYYGIAPDCRSNGATTVNILGRPQGGQVETERGRDFPSFPAANVRSKCNGTRVEGIRLLYRADANFAGDDLVTVEVIAPSGIATRRQYAISVRG